MIQRQQNLTDGPLIFAMKDSNDLPITGAANDISLSLRKPAGAFVVGTGTISQIGGGLYEYAWAANDRDTLGDLLVRIELTGAMTVEDVVEVVSHAPTADITTARMAKLDDAMQSGADGDTGKTLSDQIDGVDVNTDGIAAIKASTDLITNNNIFTRSRITSDGSIEIYKGESLTQAEGTAVDITKPTGATWPTDLTGYTVTFRARQRKSNAAGGEDTLDKAMSIITATGASQKVRLELTAAETDGLATGVNGWNYQIEAVKSNERSIITSGTVTVLERFA